MLRKPSLLLYLDLQHIGYCLPRDSSRYAALNLGNGNQHFEQLSQTWSQLPQDVYLRDAGTYRYRRYVVLEVSTNKTHVLPYEPHYQNSSYNRLNGGFSRNFATFSPSVLNNPVFQQVLNWSIAMISRPDAQNWKVQCHQFRITGDEKQEGKPTPEGIHQDGAEYVFIMLIKRHNIEGGVTRLYKNRDTIFEGMLAQPGDAVLLNDKKLFHSVSSIHPLRKGELAYRDVLVLTFHQR
ncbi:MAG: Unknown protein [uncultured Thiotrichaceae bacterium]|uniref:2OG-Fe dioxygenase family protein n=1 Tax=uncultured Thiotrichaceae bacterium TaxID=298394 RepID=A0A6S6U4D9_9GAMM|nr:MAG: Unknown protein [uncultured Thiotrichaceae bacterium]